MKTRFIFFFLFATTTILAQTKLCEERKSALYSVCYTLDKNGTFTYRFAHCTGSEVGAGKYTNCKDTLTFVFDTVIAPVTTINKHYDNELTNKVKITLYDAKNKFPIDFAEIIYSNKGSYMTDEEGNCSFDYSGGSIEIRDWNSRELTINPDKDSSNTYEIYLAADNGLGKMYVDGGTIRKMNKVGKKYELKEKVRHVHKEYEGYYYTWITKYYVER